MKHGSRGALVRFGGPGRAENRPTVGAGGFLPPVPTAK